MMPIASFYLGTTPSAPNSATLNRPQSMSQASTPRSAVTPNTASNRASMPSPLRSATSSPPPVSAFVNSQSPTSPEPKERLDRHFDTVPEERVSDIEEVSLERTGSKGSRGKSRAGTMNLEFKFPPSSSPETPPKNTAASPPPPVHAETSGRSTPASTTIAPSSVEVPPPPPMEKERSGHMIDDGESEELGETEEIALN
jgi:hypothetical protein